MAIEVYVVDAFADRPFSGNPAAVCPLPSFPPEALMQAIAAEMNLSETAFVVPTEGHFQLRWFTPQVEVDLCGHATLATAHVLWESGRLTANQPAAFHTKSGPLAARRVDDQIELDFPTTEVRPCEPPRGLIESLRVRPLFVGQSRLDYLVQVAQPQEVIDAEVDFAGLKKLGLRGVILTAAAEVADYDFVSRYFAPGCGIDEDPVTGSVHCALAPFWGARLGRTSLSAYQASRRGGRLNVTWDGPRTRLSGRAVTVLHGKFVFA